MKKLLLIGLLVSAASGITGLFLLGKRLRLKTIDDVLENYEKEKSGETIQPMEEELILRIEKELNID